MGGGGLARSLFKAGLIDEIASRFSRRGLDHD
jgi:riboflavin biosynthesis pyrimidine reductase